MICFKCLESDWRRTEERGVVTWTCNFCDASFSKDVPRGLKLGDKCRKCFTDLVIKEAKITKKKLKKNYHYSHFLKCPKCRTIYYLNNFIVKHTSKQFDAGTLLTYIQQNDKRTTK